jgi:hypothetical protein
MRWSINVAAALPFVQSRAAALRHGICRRSMNTARYEFQRKRQRVIRARNVPIATLHDAVPSETCHQA